MKKAYARDASSSRRPGRHDTGVATCAFTIQGAPLVLERFMQVARARERPAGPLSLGCLCQR